MSGGNGPIARLRGMYTGVPAIEPVAIPGSHLDLLTRPAYGVFTTRTYSGLFEIGS
jgi:hypothetical protein